MDIVGLTLFGRARYQVLACLFASRHAEGLHLREIARRTGLSPTAVHYELRLLTDAGLLTKSRDSGRLLYRIDGAHAISRELGAIIRKTNASASADPTTVADAKHWAAKSRQQAEDHVAANVGRKSPFLANRKLAQAFRAG